MPLSEKDRRRLPLYGPLQIDDPAKFLEETKSVFSKCYNSVFPYNVKLEHFELIRFLGKGGFGKVLLVSYKVFENSYYAMKIFDKKFLVEEHHVEHTLNEKRITQCVNSPFTNRLEYLSQDKSYLYFFLPFVVGGEMFGHLVERGRFEERLAMFYAAQVVLAFEYLHNLDIIFRDLKPENLLIDHFGYLKLTDFGFAKIVQKRTCTFCGTPDYISPEIVQGFCYGKSVDWWTLGVLIYEMCSGETPFGAPNQMEVYEKIVNADYQLPAYFSKSLQDIVKRFLEVDVSRRLGCLRYGVKEIKTQDWFKVVNWTLMFNRKLKAPFVPHIPPIVKKPSPELKLPNERLEDDYAELFKDF